MFVFKAAVVGAGTMGGQIAQTIAAAGIPVMLKDVDEELVQAGLIEARNVTEGQLKRQVEKGRLGQDDAASQLEHVIARIDGTTSYHGFGDVDLVIEAVPERLEVKQAVFAELDVSTPGHAVLASNTSALSITEIGEATTRPERVVGFHFFYPASVMRLIEVIEGDDTAPETVATAVSFAQAIRKTPIVCAEVPGFVVNRVLNAAMSEVWRVQEEKGWSIKAIDEAVTESKIAPMGPFFLADLLGLDTVLHVAEYLDASYPGSMYVHEGLRARVEEGKLGAKTGGEGFYADGEPQVPGDAEPDLDELADRFNLRALVECLALVEEGVTTTREVDLGMMAGTGLMPPPLARADQAGLDALLERLGRAAEEWGERFTPPPLLRRLVAQGRTGPAAGQGIFPYKRPDDGDQPATLQLETRDDVAIVWLDNPPANSISGALLDDLAAVWERVEGGGEVRALVLASANPQLFCAGADIKGFTAQMENGDGGRIAERTHALLRAFERSGVVTVAAVNGIALGGGCELAMACDVRIAAQSSRFGQPEIALGIMPGFGGTQRLPRLVGTNKALEMNLTGESIGADEAYEYGLVNRVVPDHELLDAALAWARKLAAQPPLAVRHIKQASADPALDAGLEAEQRAFAEVFSTDDAREGVAAFVEKRPARWRGT